MPVAKTPEQSEHPTTRARFLAAFARNGNVSAACRLARVGRTTVYDWRTDAVFAAAYDEAELTATEHLEAEAWRRATKGVRSTTANYYQGEKVGYDIKTEYSDGLLMFLLRARAPEKYRERFDVTTAGQPMIKEVAADLAAVL